jgi:hypothetical protein
LGEFALEVLENASGRVFERAMHSHIENLQLGSGVRWETDDGYVVSHGELEHVRVETRLVPVQQYEGVASCVAEAGILGVQLPGKPPDEQIEG